MINKADCLIYKGEKFTLEWYFSVSKVSEVKDYYEALTEGRQNKFLYLVQRMGDFGRIIDKTKFNSEGDKLYAFKPQPDRFLCGFVTGKTIIVVSAFEKKTKKIPAKEKDRALKLKAEYVKRVKEGKYYEKK